MDVVILNQKISMPITSVVLQGDNTDIVHMFFCFNCRNTLFQYMGRVITITPGSTPHATPILLMCQRCKTTIQIVDIL